MQSKTQVWRRTATIVACAARHFLVGSTKKQHREGQAPGQDDTPAKMWRSSWTDVSDKGGGEMREKYLKGQN